MSRHPRFARLTAVAVLLLVLSILTVAAGYRIAPALTALAETRTDKRIASVGVCEAPAIGSIEVESTGGTPGPSGYGTLSEAFTAINAGTHTGDVSIDVCGDTNEPATAQLNASGIGRSSYTSLTVRPAGGPHIIQGSIAGAVIKLAGADNVIIDGRPAGIGNSRLLTVLNNSGAASTAALWITSNGPGEGAANNIIRNLEIAAGAPQDHSSNNTFGIIMAGDNTSISTTSNGNDNDNNSFITNRITRARYGIVTRGVTTNLTIGTIVRDNIIGPDAFGPDEIGKVGILMQADQDAVVSHNTVQFVGGLQGNTPSGTDRIGIGIGQEAWSTTPGTIASKTYLISDNVIHDVIEERQGSAAGLVLATTGGGSPTNNIVANNFIYNIRSNGSSSKQTVGIGISGGHSDQVIFNSISLTGDVNTTSVSSPVAGYGSGIRIGVANSSSHQNLTLKNNSVYVDLSSSRTPNIRFYAISGPSAAYSFGTGGEDFNNFYIDPANPQTQTGGLGTNQGNTLTNQFSTLADWKLAYTAPQDANSIQADPLYTSNISDLHIPAGSPNVDQGTPAGGIVSDIDGETRMAAPDIGADEYRIASTLPSISPNAVTSQIGSPTLRSSIATVDDTESGPNGVIVTVNGGTSAIVNGISVSNIVNVNGAISADVQAACGASAAAFTLRATDSDGGFAETTLSVSVTPNTPPVLTYSSPQNVRIAGVATITPAVGPGDNGSIADIAIQSAGTFAGTLSVDTSGNISVSNAGPIGLHTITIRSTDNCGAFTDSTISINVFTDLPSVEFSAATFGGPESSIVTVGVLRTGDLSGSSDVNYTTIGGNANGGVCGIFGIDYQVPAGTLHFSAGEALRTFDVTLCSDLRREDPAETVGLELGGASGAVLGGRTAAEVDIFDAATQFVNMTPMVIPVGNVTSPYGTSVEVSGITQPVQDVRVTLFGLTLAVPDDLDVLLVGPQGQRFVAFAYAGGASGLGGVTVTLDDAALTHLPDGGPIPEGFNYKPTACGQVTEFPSPAPPLPYPQAACTSGPGATFAGVFAGADASGTWTLYVRDHGGAGGAAFGAAGSLAGWGMQLLSPTAAGASISGRIVTANGFGIRNAAVTIAGSGTGLPKTAYTGSFGVYSFDGLTAGQIYLVTVRAKHFRFVHPSRAVPVNDNITGLDFIAEP